jgi:hypothetical protein
MSEQPTQQERAPIKSFERLAMFTDCPGAPGKRSKLNWAVIGDNFRITIFTNDPNDTIKKGVLYAGMDPVTFELFLTKFEKILCSPNGEYQDKVDCFGAVFEDDKRTNEKTLISHLCFGKDINGMAWISVIAPNRPKIKFFFKVSEWHKVYVDGQQISDAEGSLAMAFSTIAVLRRVFYAVLANNLDNPAPKRIADTKPAIATINGQTQGNSTIQKGEFDDFAF